MQFQNLNTISQKSTFARLKFPNVFNPFIVKVWWRVLRSLDLTLDDLMQFHFAFWSMVNTACCAHAHTWMRTNTLTTSAVSVTQTEETSIESIGLKNWGHMLNLIWKRFFFLLQKARRLIYLYELCSLP